ncbi:Uncharacterised protein [BD1-7 clade bacterium]|uniref:PA14 domain-containing protein n=1 Tax=BD1-7 clade bacterium TaxID=2029982 RepID=A0A5S9QK40_9GAMM|nr:Uncharacterised protein [BD1-7 clade bacterium]CAA0120711.1 Uncharacterised protein [BD1-7 clade bacterium]
MAFGTTSGGVLTSVDTGNIVPGSEAYTHYVASYLGELADDVATAQNPKLNSVDLGWIKQSTNLRAFADGRIQHFAEEISVGRQLGYFDKSLVTRLASFRRGIESILVQGDVWAVGRAPTSIADAQGLIAKKTGTDYTIHKLAFNDVRNANGELTGDTLGAFLGTNATLKAASGAVTLKSVDTDLIHRITGNIYLSAGDHQLSIQHDDGLQLSLGGQQLVNKVGWDRDKPETANFHAAKAGFYPLHALYYQAGGTARFDVKVDGKTLSSEGGAEGVKGVPLSSVYAELTLSHNSEQHLPAKGAVDQLLAAVGNRTLGSQLAEHKSIASVDADKQHNAYIQGWSKYSAHTSISKDLLIPIFVNIGISNEGGNTAIIAVITNS